MKPLISDSLRILLCEQVGAELSNSNLYACMEAFLKNKGLDNIAKLFEHQKKEELSHSEEFLKLLTDMNAEVYIPTIDEARVNYRTMEELATAYLDREILTTESINEIKAVSIEEGNPVVEEFLRGMISKQQAEYEEATSFLDKASLLKEWWMCVLWDASLK